MHVSMLILYIHPFIHPSLTLSMDLSVNIVLFLSLSISLSACPSTCLSVGPPGSLSSGVTIGVPAPGVKYLLTAPPEEIPEIFSSVRKKLMLIPQNFLGLLVVAQFFINR